MLTLSPSNPFDRFPGLFQASAVPKRLAASQPPPPPPTLPRADMRRYQIAKDLIIPAKKRVEIMIVDDSHMNRKLVQRALEKSFSNLSIESFPDGLQAYEATTRKLYHLIIMDINMPVMDGIEASRCIRREANVLSCNRRVPILAFTTETRGDLIQQYLSAGMTDVLAKDGNSWTSLCAFVRQHTAVQQNDGATLPPSPMLRLPEINLPGLSASRQRVAFNIGKCSPVASHYDSFLSVEQQQQQQHQQLQGKRSRQHIQSVFLAPPPDDHAALSRLKRPASMA